MTQAARHLHAVDGTNHTAVAREIRKGILIVDPTSGQVAADAEATILGLLSTVEKQAKEVGTLTKKLEAEDPMEHHPKRREISEVIDYWKAKTGHERSRNSKDRFDLVRARLTDGYDFEQIRLAIDGLAAFPYVVNAQRRSEGKPSQRYDQLKHALKGGTELERFANLGHQARRGQ